ncbi:MAG: hypothetical protein QF463_11650 [Vicinamibacterales bacterium]|jgi:hypothetical protein|nr:hypothetical protein [Acidobacteriota bacterium]MDP6372885.1 hypothetical protein [Vicinamibacterales bacterium]MDP6609712.1 hypothetical protein [Vicinamibacterales bacterium]|tara:strand:- start:8492 stop:9457 length:966 start_codon:yes stop_codon:yes gene_type:complete
MIRNTRLFLSVSGGVLLLGLCVGVVAYYGGRSATETPQDRASDLEYLPAETTIVAYADLRAVMNSTLRERFRRVEPDSPAREAFETQTGINLEVDIDHVVAGFVPNAREDDDESAVVLLRGRFDDEHLEALARQHGAEVEDLEGRSLLQIEEDGRSFALAFVEPGLAMLGDLGLVRLALEASGQSVTANEDLMRLVQEMEPDYNAWAVGRLDSLTERAELPPQVAAQLPALRHFAAGGRVNGGLSGVIRADASDEAAAQNLRDVLGGLMALARMQAGSRPAWQAALDSIQLGGTGTSVALSFVIPDEMFEVLMPSEPPPGE